MMPLIGENLDFKFYLLQQFKASFKQFVYFNNVAKGQHEQITVWNIERLLAGVAFAWYEEYNMLVEIYLNEYWMKKYL